MLITHKDFQPTNIRYGFFTKDIYLPKGYTDQDTTLIARTICGADNFSILDQAHTNKVVIIERYEDSDIVADGQVTNTPNLALAVLTADCVPILLADEKNGIVATVHSGWKGARANIMNNAVEKMKQLSAEDIVAIIGPCIKQKSYEVDQNFYDDFVNKTDSNKDLFIPSMKNEHYLFDLTTYVKRKLLSLNINKIFDIDRNTYEEEENFLSYRRSTHRQETREGNLISFIMLL